MTPDLAVLAADPAVKALVAEAEARGMERAAGIAKAERAFHADDTLMDMSARITCDEIAAAIRRAEGGKA